MGFKLCLAQFLVTLLLGSIEVSTGQEEPLVTAPAGTFRGKVLTSPSGVRYASYRGIPYALPPTGERRFAKPVPFPVIQGTYNATDYGPICIQHNLLLGTPSGQEDCLFLNVFTPIVTQKTGVVPRLKSVLVYLHGGALVEGSSKDPVMGEFLTKKNIVAVTFNYRLGWLGFMRGNSSSLPGNQGHQDQLLALSWVKDNIRAFGGDPDDVTLSGVSAGSWSTSVLSVSPKAKHLFQKAILLSGTSFLFSTPDHKSNDLLEIAAKQLGCGKKLIAGNEEAVIKCLKQKPANSFRFKMDPHLVGLLTSSGDDLLKQPLAVLRKDPQYLSQVGFYNRSYLVSVTKDDAIILLPLSIPLLLLGLQPLYFVVVQELSNNLGMNKDNTRELLDKYRKIYGDLGRAAISFANDKYFVGQSDAFLETYLTKSDRERGIHRAYFMSFDHKPSCVPKQYMLHGYDTAYLFDKRPKLMDILAPFLKGEFKDEDFQLQTDYRDMIGEFVTTGNPSKNLERKHHIEWPPYDKTNKSYLSFSPQPKVLQDIFSNRRNLVFPDQEIKS